MGTNRPGEIFDGQSIWDFIALRRKDLQSNIDKVDVYNVENFQEWKENLFESFYIAPLQLGVPKIGEPFETVISAQTRDGNRNVDRIAVKVEIPVNGYVRLFEKSPNSAYIIYLNQKYTLVENNSRSGWLTTTFYLEEMSADIFKTRLNKFVKDVSQNIPEINQNVGTWNDQLLSEIENAIETKRHKLDKKHKFMKEVGLDINQNSTVFLIPPVIQKKAIPSPQNEVNSKGDSILPTLKQEVYSDILKVLISAGSAFERKPSLYKNKDEEDLRDMFLLFLETRYENTSGHGEAFNRKGKTDILLKYAPDGSNIFVAECKVWTGEIGLGSAIDQLLSYLTHRDSKTALMMFVRNKNFNPVLITAETAIKNHPNFLSFTPKTSTSSYGCMFSLPGNEMSKIQLEVMLFHFLD